MFVVSYRNYKIKILWSYIKLCFFSLFQKIGIPLYVFGPETHMTSICGMALGTRPIPQENSVEFATANFLLPSGDKSDKGSSSETVVVDGAQAPPVRPERVSHHHHHPSHPTVFRFSFFFLWCLGLQLITVDTLTNKTHSFLFVRNKRSLLESFSHC